MRIFISDLDLSISLQARPLSLGLLNSYLKLTTQNPYIETATKTKSEKTDTGSLQANRKVYLLDLVPARKTQPETQGSGYLRSGCTVDTELRWNRLLLFPTEKSSSSSSGKDHSFEFLAIPYNDFDVLVSDIDERELQAIGKGNEIEHLGPGTFSSPPFPISGIIHGRNIRYMIPLVVQRARKPNSKAVNIWFLVETGSPFTCLTEKSLKAFFGTGNVVASDEHEDQSSRIECKCSKGNFDFVNILGADAMCKLKLSIDVDWETDTFKLIKK